MTHAAKSGVAHMVAADEDQALFIVREMLGYMPSNNMEDPPQRASTDRPTGLKRRSRRSSP